MIFICVACDRLITDQETAVVSTGEGFLCDWCLEEWGKGQ